MFHLHPIAFSFADFSYWCYACDSYIEHPLCNAMEYFYEQKFGKSEFTEAMKIMKASKYDNDVPEERPR